MVETHLHYSFLQLLPSLTITKQILSVSSYLTVLPTAHWRPNYCIISTIILNCPNYLFLVTTIFFSGTIYLNLLVTISFLLVFLFAGTTMYLRALQKFTNIVIIVSLQGWRQKTILKKKKRRNRSSIEAAHLLQRRKSLRKKSLLGKRRSNYQFSVDFHAVKISHF